MSVQKPLLVSCKRHSSIGSACSLACMSEASYIPSMFVGTWRPKKTCTQLPFLPPMALARRLANGGLYVPLACQKSLLAGDLSSSEYRRTLAARTLELPCMRFLSLRDIFEVG